MNLFLLPTFRSREEAIRNNEEYIGLGAGFI